MPWTKLQSITPLPHELFSRPVDERLAEAAEWLKPQLTQCAVNHSYCERWTKVKKSTPARLLDLETGLLNPTIRLIECGDNFDQRYMTLSHRWGKVALTQTTLANLSERLLEIKVEDLPKTFQHAVTITRALEIRYIWIDCLCIVQDNPLDWEVEAAKMASIYSGSYLTLSATVSIDSRYGLIPEHSPSTYIKVDVPGTSDETIHVRQQQFEVSIDHGHSDVTGANVPWGIPLVSCIAFYCFLDMCLWLTHRNSYHVAGSTKSAFCRHESPISIETRSSGSVKRHWNASAGKSCLGTRVAQRRMDHLCRYLILFRRRIFLICGNISYRPIRSYYFHSRRTSYQH